MNIEMLGIDYKLANIELREKLSFSQSRIKELLKKLKTNLALSGLVIISTCNRTEFYFSYHENQQPVKLDALLQQIFSEEFVDADKYFKRQSGKQVVKYLFELASGIHSMIFGDDQIVSQIKTALKLANEVHSSDAVLNTVFRHAITCGKTVKSQVVLRAVSTSVATQCTEILQEFIQSKQQTRALVIGNGEIGQVVCRELINSGCEVFMTLRKYKHSEVKVPTGCTVVDYYERSKYYEQVDIVISATASPHYTITYDTINALDKKPAYMIDLAVPRDIQVEIRNVPGIKHYDIDSIGQRALRDNTQELAQISTIVDEQLKKFNEWLIFHKCTQEMLDVKQLAMSKISQDLAYSDEEQAKIEKAIHKTVEFIFYSMKEENSKELLNGIKSFALAKGY